MQCDNKECGKFRFLQYITDPNQVADVWTCDMNMAADPLHGSECFFLSFSGIYLVTIMK